MALSKTWIRGLAFLVMASPLAAVSQQLEQDVPILSEDIAGRLDGFSYEEGPVSKLEFRGTSITLGAEGKAEVEFQDGRTRVDVDVEKLPPPGQLGPFATYVLWAVTSDGRASNLGSIEVKNGRGSLEATTALSQFALIVSAEPHFAVTAPSRAIVLQNLGKRVHGRKITITGLKQRIDYSGLAPQPRDATGKTPSDLVQARYALAIAEDVDADRLAATEFSKAQGLLARAEAAAQERKYKIRNTAPEIARTASQSAENARRLAVSAGAAERAREEAAQQASAAAAVATAAEAEEGKRRAALAAEQSAAEANRAARADLVARLNRALPTRDTERGIVAEIAGVQFDIGAATLNSEAREALARFAGIVGVYPSMTFRVEGHTDSTGGYELNRELSLKRASTVRDYLVSQGVASSRIDVEGLGPDRPVASNDTSDGRARNRRVEIILSGDPVGAP